MVIQEIKYVSDSESVKAMKQAYSQGLWQKLNNRDHLFVRLPC